MPSIFIDSDLRRFYEVPDVAHTIVDVGGGLRRYTPNDVGAAPIITRYDLLAEIYSPWVDHRNDADGDYAPLAFLRSGGAVIDATPGSELNAPTELFLQNDLWRFVPANYPHEMVITGNLRIQNGNQLAFDVSPHTAAGAVVRIESSVNLVVRTVSSGSGLSPEQAAQLQQAADIAAADLVYDHTSGELVYCRAGTNSEIMRKAMIGPGAVADASAVQP